VRQSSEILRALRSRLLAIDSVDPAPVPGEGAHADVEWIGLSHIAAVPRILTAVAARRCA